MSTSEVNKRPFQKKKFLWIFFLVNLLLSSWYLDYWTSPNAVSRALPALTVIEEGTVCIDTYNEKTGDKSKVGDHYYSDKAPLPGFVLIPFYGFMRVTGLSRTNENTGQSFPIHIWRSIGHEDGRQFSFTRIIPLLLAGSFLMGALPFCLIIFWTFNSLAARKSKISPVLLSMLAFYGSYLWVYSGTFFNHIFSACLLLLSYLFIKKKKYLYSGLLLGLSFLTEYPVGLALPLWLILIYLNEKDWKPMLQLGLGMAPSLLAIVIYNYLITGIPYKMLNAYHAFHAFQELGENYGFQFPRIEAIWGMSFSPYMGLFLYCPVLLLVLWHWIRKMYIETERRKQIIRLLKDYAFVFCLAYFLLIASFFTWWGGWSFGPRYLIPMACIFIYEGLHFISKSRISKWVFVLFCGIGLAHAWLANSTLMYMLPDKLTKPDAYAYPLTQWLLPELVGGRFNAGNLPSLLIKLSPGMAAFLWLVLFGISLVFLQNLYNRWYPVSAPALTPTPAKGRKGRRKNAKKQRSKKRS